jgi:Pretoxin HINT domain
VTSDKRESEKGDWLRDQDGSSNDLLEDFEDVNTTEHLAGGACPLSSDGTNKSTLEPGDIIWLELPEMFVAGEAEVLAVRACPPLEVGTHPIITGTFRHEADKVVDLHVADSDAPIGCTAEHPFWSTTQSDFVPASKLEVGERILTAYGNSARITSIVPRAGPQVVYGLEVYGEHVYHVGSEGLLAHNASARPELGSSSRTRTVYRVVRTKRDIQTALKSGLIAKAPGNAKRGPAFHVARGSDFDTRFISTTRSLKEARAIMAEYGGAGILRIDLRKASRVRVYDLSTTRKAAMFVKYPRTRNTAVSKRELLLEGNVPAEAISQASTR